MAVPLGDDVIDLAHIHPAHEELETAGVGFLDERFDSGSGGLVQKPGKQRGAQTSSKI
jgi:hypothetical protein